jgi:hypothetical protein
MPVKLRIEVRRKGAKYGEPGGLIGVIPRIPWCEAIGNFNPMFCRYQGKRHLVQSMEGDLSDPFRRNETYLKSLYIEIDPPLHEAAAAMGRKGGSSRSEAKIASSRLNGILGKSFGKLGGRPRKTEVANA